MYGHIGWCSNANPDLLPFDTQNRDRDLVANDDRFICPSTQDKQLKSPCSQAIQWKNRFSLTLLLCAANYTNY